DYAYSAATAVISGDGAVSVTTDASTIIVDAVSHVANMTVGTALSYAGLSVSGATVDVTGPVQVAAQTLLDNALRSEADADATASFSASGAVTLASDIDVAADVAADGDRNVLDSYASLELTSGSSV